jgi:DNA polymerase I-like protein with 3'-5' exonuclease and polymerase domains
MVSTSINVGTIPSWVEYPDPDLYLSDNYLVLDWETTNLDKGAPINMSNHIVCGSWKFNGVMRSIHGNELAFGELLQDIEQCDFIVAANAKFELGWLKRCGVQLEKLIIYDTQIGEYVILGNRSANLDLDSTAKRYGFRGKDDPVSRLIKAGVCPSLIYPPWLLQYNRIDVEQTEHVFLRQRKILKDTGLLPTQYTRCLFTPVLADIEFNGMYLDKSRVVPVYRRMLQEQAIVLKELDEMTGGINPRSSKQVAEFVYDVLKFKELGRKGKPRRTPAGNRMTDSDTLLALTATNARQKKFIEIKKKQAYYEAKVTKALAKFYKACEDKDEPGIIRASFNQTVTKNHRLSSSGGKYKLQFQNFDREFKPLFKARTPGWKVGERDQAQLEFRCSACLSQDKRAMSDIVKRIDVHSVTATELFTEQLLALHGGEMPSLAMIKKLYGSTFRQDSKPETFKPLYGGEYGTPAQMRYYAAFREKYPDLDRTQKMWTEEVLNNGKLVTQTGLIFYWPGTSINSHGQITNRRNIYNYPISELAGGEIVPIGVVCLWHRMKSLGMQAFLINTIHDSAITELPEEEEEQWKVVGTQAFVDDAIQYLRACYNIDFNVPLEVEADVNVNWHDSESWCSKWLYNQKEEKQK